MTTLAKQMGAKRIINGVRIPHPCGDPEFPRDADMAIRREIVRCALEAIQTDVDGPTVFEPNISRR
jgi:glycine reductase